MEQNMDSQSRPAEDTISIEELCQVTLVDLAQNVAIGPWILKFIGTLLPITLGLLLGVLARAL
jgi:hypothetical protein